MHVEHLDAGTVRRSLAREDREREAGSGLGRVQVLGPRTFADFYRYYRDERGYEAGRAASQAAHAAQEQG